MPLAIVIVTWNTGEDVRASLDALGPQLRAGDEVIVVDNASADATAAIAAGHPAVTRVLETGANLGFAAGCNRGAAAAGDQADVLLFLNPDCVAEPGCLDALRRAPAGWAAWMGLVTLADGETVNTAGNEVHYLGLSWAGGIGRPVSEVTGGAVEVSCLSGACLAIRRAEFDELGGFHEPFFMYCEDLDLSLRLRLAGHRIGLVPDARVRHDYAFEKGVAKWRLLERNRWLTVLRCYPGRLLAGVLPGMLLLEVGLLGVAAAGGWRPAKLRAIGEVAAALPRTLRERRAVQATRRVPVTAFASGLRADLDSPYFGALGRASAVRFALALYWRAVRALL